MFNLETNSYKPFRKDSSTPTYIHHQSNQQKHVIQGYVVPDQNDRPEKSRQTMISSKQKHLCTTMLWGCPATRKTLCMKNNQDKVRKINVENWLYLILHSNIVLIQMLLECCQSKDSHPLTIERSENANFACWRSPASPSLTNWEPPITCETRLCQSSGKLLLKIVFFSATRFIEYHLSYLCSKIYMLHCLILQPSLCNMNSSLVFVKTRWWG